MSLEYLLIFGLGLTVAAVLATIGGGTAEFVIDQIKLLIN